MCSALYIPVLMGPGLCWTWKAQRLGETLALVLDKEPAGPLSPVLRALLQAGPFWALGAASSQGPPCLPKAEVLPDSAPVQPHLPPWCTQDARTFPVFPALECPSPVPSGLPAPTPILCSHIKGVRPPTEPFNHPQSKATPQAQATGRENKTRSCAVMSADGADGRSNKN